MKRFAFTIGLWLATSLLAVAQPDAAREHFNRGVELQQKGDLAGARQAYEAALKIAPKRVDVLSNLGLVYLNLQQAEKAVACFTQALALQPELTAVRMYLGLAHFRAGKFDAAANELTQVLAVQPQHPQALHLLGLCHLKRNELPQGVAVLEAALRANPTNRDAAYTLATAYVGSHELDKAEALLAGPLRAVESAEIHLVRGALLNAARNPKAALEELQQAAQLKDALPLLHTQRGYAYLLLVEYEAAAREFGLALQHAPHDFHANAYLGWLHIQEKRYGEAGERLALVLRQQPDNAAILFQFGQIQQINGQHEQAAATLERVVKLRPALLPAHVLLSKAYSKLKRQDDFARTQATIRQLTAEEQERNLASPESSLEQENSLPQFTQGLSGKPLPAKKAQH